MSNAPGPRNWKPPMRGKRVRVEFLISASVVVVLLAAWLILTGLGLVRPLFLPGPQQLYEAWGRLSPTIAQDVFDSLVLRIIPGFLIGSTVGVTLGIAMAMSRNLRAALNPIIETVRPLPPLALIPLLILWFGIGIGSQLILVAFGAFIIMVVTSFEAVRNVAPIYLQAASVLGARSQQVFRRIILPAIVPDIFGGIRIALAASFGYDVAAELIGAQSGLGYRLVLARRYLLTENIVVILIVIAILALVCDQAVQWLNRRFTAWKART